MILIKKYYFWVVLSYYLLIGIRVIGNAHPYPQNFTHDNPLDTRMVVDFSNYYDVQYNFDIAWYNGVGLYKNVDINFLKFVIGTRFKDGKQDLKFRFLLLDHQGVEYSTIRGCKTKNYYDFKNGCEYFFTQIGINVLDWNNLGFMNSDINVVRLSWDFILEERVFNNKFFLNGLPFHPKTHSFYFSNSFNIGLTRLSFDSLLITSMKSNEESFWDLETGLKLQLGYDYRYEKEYYSEYNGRVDTNFSSTTHSLLLFTDYRYFVFNDFSVLSYGLKLKLKPIYILWIDLSYSNNVFSYDEDSGQYYKAQIDFVIPIARILRILLK